MISFLRVITYVITAIFAVLISCFIVNYIITKKNQLKLLTDKQDFKKQINEFKQSYLNVEKKENKIISYLKRLILKANIRLWWFKPPLLILATIAIFMVSAIWMSFSFNVVQAICIAAFLAVTPEIVLYLVGEYVGSKTDKSFIDFLNLIDNFLEIRDDINFAMEKAATFNVQLPIISEYCQDYVFDISHGYTPMAALQHFSDKVDNVQIKNLLETLISCNINSGKYLKTVKQSKNNYMELYDKLLERKKHARKNRMTILLMLIIFVGICGAVMFINGDTYYLLTHSLPGIIISTFTLVSFIITFFVAINVGHFTFD